VSGPGALDVFSALGAIGPDGSLAFYLALGMVATVNPCGFAMLPAYLSYFLGLESPHLAALGAAGGSRREQAGEAVGVARAVGVALAVSAGFLAVFATAGAVVELTSLPVYEYMPWVSVVVGLVLVGLGIAMVAGVTPVLRLPKLDRGGQARTTGSMVVFGVSYAIASIGCTLPTFLTAVAGTIDRESVLDGMVVFVTYAAGMALVLVTLTVTMALARTSVVRFLRAAQPYIGSVAGVLVALAGLYVVYYAALELRTYRTEAGGTVPSSAVTDLVSGWSYDVTAWIRRTGSVRIGTIVVLLLAALAVGLHAWRNREREPAPGKTGAGSEDGSQVQVSSR
jgi:cytochrome c-type biogenesis protein